MSKYDPLKAFLASQSLSRLPVTFAELEKVLGFRLPASARTHQAWWANESTGHAQARAWLGAGFETEQVDVAGRKLVFKRAPATAGMQEEPRMFKPAEDQAGKNPFRSTLFGAMKGTFTIEPGYDLTRPVYTDEEWDEIEKEMLAKFDRAFAGPNK